MTEAYCVKCKKKTEMKNAQEVTMKNGRTAMKGDHFHRICRINGQ